MFLLSRSFRKTPLILLILTTALLTLAYPSFEQSYVIWFALVPWLFIIKTEKEIAFKSILIGSVFFLVNLAWLRYVTYSGLLLLSFYSMGYFLAFSLLTKFIIIRFKLPLTVIAPFIWVSLEYVRSFFLTGFPWLFLGHSQYKNETLIQIADITGVYGISFTIVLVNSAITEFFLSYNRRLEVKRFSFYVVNIIFPILLIIVIKFYGHRCLRQYDIIDGPKISLVQGNISQSVKNNPDAIQQIGNLQKYLDLSQTTILEKPDLVVWPETMVPGIFNINPNFFGRDVDRISQTTIKNLAYILDTNLLIGGTAIVIKNSNQTFYNSAFYLDEKGSVIDRYDKIHLVPFGEYTPLKNYLPFLAKLVPYEVNLSPGEEKTIFNLYSEESGNIKFAILICFEDSLPQLVREFCNEGAVFLINITNDGWFKGSAELDQHLSLMVFRAIENRVGMARAANTGISAFIDPVGNISHKLQDSNGIYKSIEGVLTRKISLVKNNNTFYKKHGDIFVIICSYFSVVLFCFALLFSRKPKRLRKWNSI